MNAFNRTAVAMCLIAWSCAPAFCQEAPPELNERAARDVARTFLTVGGMAPRPKLKRADFAKARATREGKEVALPANGGPCFEFRVPANKSAPMKFTISVSPRGHVVDYMSTDRTLAIPYEEPDGSPRSEAARKEQRRARITYTIDELRKRAETFLEQVYPDYRARRFATRSSEKLSDPTEYRLRLEETLRPGVKAIYPNRITVVINPESGMVTRYTSTTVPEVVKANARLPVTEKAARVRAMREHPGHSVDSAELLLIVKKSEPTPVWLIFTKKGEDTQVVVVSAKDGSLLTSEETLK